MKHKKRRSPRPERTPHSSASNPAWERIKDRFRRIDRRMVMLTGIWFLAAELVYTVCNYFELTFHFYLYAVALGVLALSYFVLNGGSFSRSIEFDAEALPKTMSAEEKQKAEQLFQQRRTWAKNLLPPFFAIVMTLCIDMIYLNVVLAW